MASDFVAVGSNVKVLWTEKELKAQRLGWAGTKEKYNGTTRTWTQ